jgi:hypothetical protein
MREIKMKTISAGPGGTFLPGSLRTLPRHEAAALVMGGHAEYTTIEPPEKAVVNPPEAEIVNPEETAEKKLTKKEIKAEQTAEVKADPEVEKYLDGVKDDAQRSKK